MPEQKNDTSLNKFISRTGYCSRREADKLIRDGRVLVNNFVAITGNRVTSGDEVKIDGQPLPRASNIIYIAFNKPPGVTSTTDRKDKTNIIDFLNFPERIFPVGRLDKPSQGLIFLTNDGDIVNKILRAGNNHEKEYMVTVDKTISMVFIKSMGNGVNIAGITTQKCFVRKESKFVFRIILIQGLNRQIRKMCEALGYHVTKLERIRIMNITLYGITPGSWRYLAPGEIAHINKLVANSVKTKEASLKLP